MIALENETFNMVVNYLMARPYKEVHQLIAEIQNTAKTIEVASSEEQPESEENE
jgi:hypothetical protein